MILKWGNAEERLLKFMNIAPKKKLEWLYQMNEFMHKFLSKRQRKIWQRLRQSR